jgi:hypothetical protein
LDIDILFSDGTFTPLRKALNQSLPSSTEVEFTKVKIRRQAFWGFPVRFPKPTVAYGFLFQKYLISFAIDKLLTKVLDFVWVDFFIKIFKIHRVQAAIFLCLLTFY